MMHDVDLSDIDIEQARINGSAIFQRKGCCAIAEVIPWYLSGARSWCIWIYSGALHITNCQIVRMNSLVLTY